MAQRDLGELTPAECGELLRTVRVGRMVYVDDDGPVAVPVNYALAGSDIIVRVEGGAKLAAMSQPALAFEVDDIDDDTQSGWSVIARGPGEVVDIAEVPHLLRRIDGLPLLPWAIGIHNVWLRITPRTLTGRRLGERRTTALF